MNGTSGTSAGGAPGASGASGGAAEDASADTVTGHTAAEIESLLARVRTNNAQVRHDAIEQLMALSADDIPVLRARLLAPLGSNPLNVHAAIVRAIRAATGGRENADYDLLEVLLAAPRTADLDVAVERVLLARAIGRIQDADAGRALLPLAFEHQHIFRLETARIIRNTLHEYVLPALIEVRLPNDDQRVFIRQVRESIRRVSVSETVQTRDNALLGQILRAFGATHQLDAVNVVVSYVNIDRTQVRDAARWAVTQYGRDAINALRTAYENTVGEDANPQWGWERTARELYEAYDRRRAEEVTRALDEGLAHGRAQRYAEMLERFQFVLARQPLFARRTEMVAPLLTYARELERTDALQAEGVYRLALRVDPQGSAHTSVQSTILFLEAERALAQGVADPELYRAALRVDPRNARARAQLSAVAQVEVMRARRRTRTLWALALLAMALSAAWLLVARGRGEDGGKPRAKREGEGEGEGEGAGGATASAGATDPGDATATDAGDGEEREGEERPSAERTDPNASSGEGDDSRATRSADELPVGATTSAAA